MKISQLSLRLNDLSFLQITILLNRISDQIFYYVVENIIVCLIVFLKAQLTKPVFVHLVKCFGLLVRREQIVGSGVLLHVVGLDYELLLVLLIVVELLLLHLHFLLRWMRHTNWGWHLVLLNFLQVLELHLILLNFRSWSQFFGLSTL